MQLTDILPVEQWAALEREIHARSGMRPRIYNPEGVGITDESLFANDLCARIQSIPKAQTFICALAHTNMAAMARNSRSPVVEECDAGMVKIVVPIFAGDEFLGAAGGCGLLLEDGEVDTFMVNRSADISEDEVAALSREVRFTSRQEAEELARWIAVRIEAAVAAAQPPG
jgi:ligand-binding sensor protein